MFRSKIATFSFVLASAVAVWGTTGCTSESTNKAPSEDSNLTGEDTPKKQSLTGSFVKHAAVGGESTGYALELPDAFNLVELDLTTNGFDSKFTDGHPAYVEGTFKTVEGTEIPTRNVLVVKVLDLQYVAL